MALSKALGMDLPALAELLRSKGRGKDTMLAHITPKEAALLKRRGGSGSVNPDTGLPEYEDSGSYDFSPPEPASPVYDVVQPGGAFTQVSGGTGQQYTPGGDAYAPTASVPVTEQSFNLAQNQSPTMAAYGAGSVPQGQALDTGGTAYAPAPLTPMQLGQAAVGQTVEGYPGPKAETAKPSDATFGDKALKALTDPGTLARLGLTGALGAFGANQARKAGTQTQAATQEQKALAQPYSQQGQQLVAQAQQGTLSAASKQALDAAKAQINQGVANRGGVGSQQAANQVANLYQSLIDNQYKYGLQIMQIGDNITMGAIKSGLQLDQQLQATTNNFYSQLASIAAGGSGYIPVAPSLQTQRTA